MGIVLDWGLPEDLGGLSWIMVSLVVSTLSLQRYMILKDRNKKQLLLGFEQDFARLLQAFIRD